MSGYIPFLLLVLFCFGILFFMYWRSRNKVNKKSEYIEVAMPLGKAVMRLILGVVGGIGLLMYYGIRKDIGLANIPILLEVIILAALLCFISLAHGIKIQRDKSAKGFFNIKYIATQRIKQPEQQPTTSNTPTQPVIKAAEPYKHFNLPKLKIPLIAIALIGLIVLFWYFIYHVPAKKEAACMARIEYGAGKLYWISQIDKRFPNHKEALDYCIKVLN